MTFKPPTFDLDETVFFSGPGGYISSSEWNMSRHPPVKRILFRESFPIHDSSLQTLLSDRPALLPSLEAFEVSDSHTGNGRTLSDPAVQSLLGATPNLQVLRLDACTALTDATLIRAFHCCPLLIRVRLTGTGQRTGSIRGAALRELKTHLELCPDLKELVLYNQAYDQHDVIALSRVRQELVIKLVKSTV